MDPIMDPNDPFILTPDPNQPAPPPENPNEAVVIPSTGVRPEYQYSNPTLIFEVVLDGIGFAIETVRFIETPNPYLFGNVLGTFYEFEQSLSEYINTPSSEMFDQGMISASGQA
jgi:hypothetical protein